MSRKASRETEDIALLKLVGAVLENTTEKPGQRGPWLRWFGSRRLRRLQLKVRVLLRRHPLVPASLVLCVVVCICIANVTRSSPGEDQPRSGQSARGERFQMVHAPPTVHAESEGVTEEDRRAIRPLSYWLALLEDPDWKVRSDAAFELVRKSRSSELVLSALFVLLDDPHAGVRFWAVDRFRVAGMYRAKVKSTMRDFLGNDELLSLYREGTDGMRQAFLAIVRSWMTDLDDDVRWAGLAVCGMLGSHAAVFEPTLVAIAENDIHEQYRRQAEVMLRNLPVAK